MPDQLEALRIELREKFPNCDVPEPGFCCPEERIILMDENRVVVKVDLEPDDKFIVSTDKGFGWTEPMPKEAVVSAVAEEFQIRNEKRVKCLNRNEDPYRIIKWGELSAMRDDEL